MAKYRKDAMVVADVTKRTFVVGLIKSDSASFFRQLGHSYSGWGQFCGFKSIVIGNVMLTCKWHVWLRKIHAKTVLSEGTEIAGFGDRADARLGVVDKQCVHLRDEIGTVGMLTRICTGVPQDGVGGFDGVVYRDGVGSLVHRARG